MTFAYFSSEKSRAPAASRTGYTFGKRPRDAEGEKKLLSFLINPSVTATPCHLHPKGMETHTQLKLRFATHLVEEAYLHPRFQFVAHL